MSKNLLAFLVFSAVGVRVVEAADWPRFRGPDGSGVSTEQGLLHTWPENGPGLLWQSQGAGRGYGSAAVAGDRLYTLGDRSKAPAQGEEFLGCFARQDGKPLWTVRI